MAKKATSASKAKDLPKEDSALVPADAGSTYTEPARLPDPRLDQGMMSDLSPAGSALPAGESPAEVFSGFCPPQAPLSDSLSLNTPERGASEDLVVADQIQQSSDTLPQPQTEDDIPPSEVQPPARKPIEIILPGNYQTGHGRPANAHKGPPRYHLPQPPKLR